MKYKIRKGFETPCKIKGFLSTDYWLFVGSCGAVIILLFLGVRSGITSGDWSQALMFLLIGIIGLPMFSYKLKQKAKSKKYDVRRESITISNLEISKKLIRRK